MSRLNAQKIIRFQMHSFLINRVHVSNNLGVMISLPFSVEGLNLYAEADCYKSGFIFHLWNLVCTHLSYLLVPHIHISIFFYSSDILFIGT